jgi:hypothetical protein
MSNDTTGSIDSLIPRMQAESGFDPHDSAAPLRVSGFLCLICGLLSFFSMLFQPLLFLPIIAFGLGTFALRRWSGQQPLGIRPAMVGMVLAAGFGSCGLFLPWMKTMSLGGQAERFTRQYMDVVALGHNEMALELRKDYVNRFPDTLPLKEHYAMSEEGSRQLDEFEQESLNTTFRKVGPGAEWVLDRPTRVYYSYGREHAEVVWVDSTGETPSALQFFLDYIVDSNGDGQWHIAVAQTYRERLVAESVL